ncbi:hypothetical protein NX059_008850 [Plenodomus lindquistii]|nr:hypothetical protein NX059_008850 [Plenodomus lindquistii]
MHSPLSDSSQRDSALSELNTRLETSTIKSMKKKRYRSPTANEDETSPPSKRRSTQSGRHGYPHKRSASGGSDAISSVHTASALSETEGGIVRAVTTHQCGTPALSETQRNLIRTWYNDFARFHTVPQSRGSSTGALALLVHASADIVDDFIDELQTATIDTGQSPSSQQRENYSPSRCDRKQTSPASSSLACQSAHLPTPMLDLVQRYINTCRRQRSRTDGRRTVNKGHLRCTFGCGYQTARVFDWRRHEETHEPQELWLCSICYSVNKDNPFMVNRKDKFLRHVKEIHREEETEKMLQKSKVDFTPRGGLKCGDCGDECGNWEDRCRHMLTHFEQEKEERGRQGQYVGGKGRERKKRKTGRILEVSSRDSEEG